MSSGACLERKRGVDLTPEETFCESGGREWSDIMGNRKTELQAKQYRGPLADEKA